jgi:hypothetical protein
LFARRQLGTPLFREQGAPRRWKETQEIVAQLCDEREADDRRRTQRHG